MRFAFKTAPQNTAWAGMLAVWQEADGIEIFESGWTFDHFYPIFSDPAGPCLEGWMTLAALAQATRRLRLGTLVTGIHYRHPAVLANMAATLDIVSGGRLELGIGAGWNEEEARGLGIPFPSMRERFEMLEETLQICLRMWSGEHGDERPFEGTHYHLERPLNSPQSLTRPHPPIMIGGSGERKTLRLVARYADACNLFPTPDLPRKLEVLRQHCEAEGRDYDTITKTCIFSLDVGENGSKVGELIDTLRGFAGMGIQAVIGSVPQVDRIRPVEIIGREVIPAVADL